MACLLVAAFCAGCSGCVPYGSAVEEMNRRAREAIAANTNLTAASAGTNSPASSPASTKETYER